MADRFRARGLPLFLALAAGGAVSACSQPEESGLPVPYVLSSRPVLPFPTDAILVDDPNTVTGRRVAVGPKGSNLGDVDEALFLLGENFTESLAEMDGWSTLGPVFAPVPAAIDPGSLEGHLLLVDLDAQQIVRAELSAIEGQTEYERQLYYVVARARSPLAPRTRHAIVLLRGLTTEAGEALAPAPAFTALLEGQADDTADPAQRAAAEQRLTGVREALGALGIGSDQILAADSFSTESIDEETDVLLAAMRSGPTPELILDADGDGAPDVYTNPTDDPRGNVTAGDYSAVRALVRARFALPNFRKDLDGRLQLDKNGAREQSREDVELVLTVPKGAGPFPIVVFHHGVAATKEVAFDFANDLAARGMAVVAIDCALHGYRTDRPGNAGTRFLNVTRPDLVLDNFRQAEADQAYLARVIDVLGGLDLLGDGSRPLDVSRRFYLGESLGAIIGAAVVGQEPSFEGALLMVGGGTLFEFFDRVLSGFEFQGFPTQLFSTVAQTVLDRGDPTNYARRSMNKQILLMQAMNDNTIPAGASVALARAMELPLVEPVQKAPGDLPVLPGPVSGRGWTQFAPAGHDLFHATDKPAYAPARAQMLHYLETWARTGTAEISSADR